MSKCGELWGTWRCELFFSRFVVCRAIIFIIHILLNEVGFLRHLENGLATISVDGHRVSMNESGGSENESKKMGLIHAARRALLLFFVALLSGRRAVLHRSRNQGGVQP